MVFFVIAGIKENADFSHTCYIANYLSLMLPKFAYDAISIERNQWKDWLAALNKEKNWVHLESPLIWKHITYGNGKDIYIGGITKFWEYVFDYYNVSSFLTEDELKKLVKDYAQFNRY